LSGAIMTLSLEAPPQRILVAFPPLDSRKRYTIEVEYFAGLQRDGLTQQEPSTAPSLEESPSCQPGSSRWISISPSDIRPMPDGGFSAIALTCLREAKTRGWSGWLFDSPRIERERYVPPMHSRTLAVVG
jgi:hypothetical protein